LYLQRLPDRGAGRFGIKPLFYPVQGGDVLVASEIKALLALGGAERLVAEVEVASYLSGGIDSSAVLGLAQQRWNRPIRAFTIVSGKR
jgi:asparagine synthetase B (glutamine-hydrolysing)